MFVETLIAKAAFERLNRRYVKTRLARHSAWIPILGFSYWHDWSDHWIYRIYYCSLRFSVGRSLSISSRLFDDRDGFFGPHVSGESSSLIHLARSRVRLNYCVNRDYGPAA